MGWILESVLTCQPLPQVGVAAPQPLQHRQFHRDHLSPQICITVKEDNSVVGSLSTITVTTTIIIENQIVLQVGEEVAHHHHLLVTAVRPLLVEAKLQRNLNWHPHHLPPLHRTTTLIHRLRLCRPAVKI